MSTVKYKDPITGEWLYTGAPMEVKGMTMDLLWENPDPTAAFAAQTVALDLSQYDFVLISYEMFANYSAHATEIGLVGKTLQINSVDTSASWSTNINSFGRRMEVGNNGIVFRSGSMQGATSTVNDNRAIIPLQIYGLRNTPVAYPEGGGTTESITHPGCFYRMVNGVQEWLNPPMELGVEYKTTERYLGKPVYTQVVDIGAIPDSTVKSVKFADSCAKCVSTHGEMHRPNEAPNESYELPYWDLVNDNTVGVYTTISRNGEGTIDISTKKNWGTSGWYGRATVKYTKTTD